MASKYKLVHFQNGRLGTFSVALRISLLFRLSDGMGRTYDDPCPPELTNYSRDERADETQVESACRSQSESFRRGHGGIGADELGNAHSPGWHRAKQEGVSGGDGSAP